MAAQIGNEATAATLLKCRAPVAFDETSGCKVSSQLPPYLKSDCFRSGTTCISDCLHALESVSQT